jgi:DNA-binding transcriptional ArsR family regulator
MDAKSRKVFNCLTKLGGEQEVFDLSIAVKMTEDAVQGHLDALSGEGLVACRRDGGKEFWSVASAQPEPARAGAGARGGAAGKKRGKAMAGPDDSFADLIDEPTQGIAGATPPMPAPAPPPIRAAAPEVEDFEFAPAAAPTGAPRGPAPEPKREREAKRKQDGGPAGKPENDGFGEKPKREQSVGPDDRFQEFAEKFPAKPKLPVQLMAWAAALVLMLILFIMSSSSGGKAKKAQLELDRVNTKIDSLNAETGKEIDKLWRKTAALEKKVTSLEESRKAAASRPAAATDNKAKKPKGRQ